MLIQENPGTTMTLKVIRDGMEQLVQITPDTVKGDNGEPMGQIGAHAPEEFAQFPDFMIRDQQYGPIAAIGKSISYAWSRVELTLMSIGKMVTGKISLDNLSGPITIAKVAGDSAGYGIEAFLGFMAYLSISLGVLNLLPIPVLDGGHLMFYAFEKVLGRPLSQKVQEGFFRIGMFLLLSLMFFTTFNDLKDIGLFN